MPRILLVRPLVDFPGVSSNYQSRSSDGVAKFQAAADAITRHRHDEVLTDSHARVAEEDPMSLGRKTDQEWAAYWPTSDVQSFADHINSVTKYLVSNTLGVAPWAERDSATVLEGAILDCVAHIKSLPGRNIGNHGSPTLVAALIDAGLLDELRLEIYPVIAGCGDRLFEEGRTSRKLRLLHSKTSSTGAVILAYQSGAAIG
jgi:dihydrofolate reductase